MGTSLPATLAQASTVQCPQCSHVNSAAVEFCTNCHYTLIHRCPKCWHEQRAGIACEKCGTNFALYGELQIEDSMAEENRLWWDKFWAGVSVYLQVLALPFMTAGALLRGVIVRAISSRLSNR